MNKTIKTLVLGAALALPLASFAEEAKPVAKPAAQPIASAEHKEESMHVTLEGAKHENTAEIVKLAKEAGAQKASFNSKSNVLTLSGNKFNKEQFTSSLTKALPGVSVKN